MPDAREESQQTETSRRNLRDKKKAGVHVRMFSSDPLIFSVAKNGRPVSSATALKACQACYPHLFTPDMEAQKTSKHTYVDVGVRTTPLSLLSKE
jgi:hypothetical protein